MGLARISWNSVRVFSKLRTGLFRVLYHGTGFGTARGTAYAHSMVGTTLGVRCRAASTDARNHGRVRRFNAAQTVQHPFVREYYVTSASFNRSHKRFTSCPSASL